LNKDKWSDFCTILANPAVVKKELYRIFLCDDDPDEALFLETGFLNAGLVVELQWFNRCSSLLDHLTNLGEVPDIIFVDLNMPGENGLECLAQIKKLSVYSCVPVMMYSTSALSKDVTDAFKNGASLYLLKTSSEKELIEMVQYVVKMEGEHLHYSRKEGFCYCPNNSVDIP
jgi:DNA-binding response OmpR family regulator